METGGDGGGGGEGAREGGGEEGKGAEKTERHCVEEGWGGVWELGGQGMVEGGGGRVDGVRADRERNEMWIGDCSRRSVKARRFMLKCVEFSRILVQAERATSLCMCGPNRIEKIPFF